ncbi:hypothetical protein Hbl1158_07340 [Halobaculum sp. CBA1158]|uniref:hypothetical protein n=1 Tax=Halobaculum sp. CBA1158 TaxID=2904243 RepID=UPI001F1AF7E2|nr:hypothetical protein [Halobaculum sp. CBA1158]UIP01152.1 hypothetical protein Hbl1158_07340 [Halobaculum sp. CBA1158]
MPRRRGILAATGLVLTGGLAGCTRPLRSNDVPGGVLIRNERPEAVRVRLRAASVATPGPDEPADRTPAGGFESGTVVQQGTYPVAGDDTGTIREFFPGPGAYVLEATVDGASARDAIRLYPALGGGGGADTVIVTVSEGGVAVAATERD